MIRIEVYWNYLYKWCDIKKKQIEPIDWNGKKPNKTELCGHMNIDERAEKLWKVLKAYTDLKGQKQQQKFGIIFSTSIPFSTEDIDISTHNRILISNQLICSVTGAKDESCHKGLLLYVPSLHIWRCTSYCDSLKKKKCYLTFSLWFLKCETFLFDYLFIRRERETNQVLQHTLSSSSL